MGKRLWYAVLNGDEDLDWGCGSRDYEEAVRMVMAHDWYDRIAVIEEGDNPICVDVILREDL